MSEVKRLSMDMQYPFQYMEDENGDLVYYKDYAELKAQRDALAAENAALRNAFSPKEISTKATDTLSDTAVLKIDGDEFHSWQWVDNEEDVIRAVLDFFKPETQATDAYLKSVRAGAVEDAAKRLFGQGYTFEVLTRFAAQLRAGEPS